MEDAATAEISRAQIWQWIQHKQEFNDGRRITEKLYHDLKSEEVKALSDSLKIDLSKAEEVLDQLVGQDHFEEFLTTKAMKNLHSETLPTL